MPGYARLLLDGAVFGPRSQLMTMKERRSPMMTFGPISGLTMSTTGPKMPCKGSNTPQESSFCALGVAVSFGGDFETGPASPFLLFPFFAFEPRVLALGLEVTPAFRALTRSSPYVFCPSAAPFSIGPTMQRQYHKI